MELEMLGRVLEERDHPYSITTSYLLSHPKQFQLRCYLPSPHHPDAIFHTLYNKGKSSREPFRLIIPTVCPLNTRVYFQWFTHRYNDNDDLCQFLAASGNTTIEELLFSVGRKTMSFVERLKGKPSPSDTPVVKMYNERGEPIGELKFEPFQMECGQLPRPEGHDESTELLTNFQMREGAQIIEEKGLTLHPDIDPSFLRVSIPTSININTTPHRYSSPTICNVRVPFYFQSLMEFQTEHSMVSARYVLNVLHLVLSYLNITPTEFTRYPLRHPEVLAQVCALFSWCCPYLTDESCESDSHGRPINLRSCEQFSYPRSVPDLVCASGDCEDFARETVMMFQSVRALPITSVTPKELVSLVYLSHFYTPVIVDAIIKQRPDFKPGLHMYTKLIPWRFLIDRIQWDRMPPEMQTYHEENNSKAVTEAAVDEDPFAVLVEMKHPHELRRVVSADQPALPVLQIESTDGAVSNWDNDDPLYMRALKSLHTVVSSHSEEVSKAVEKCSWSLLPKSGYQHTDTDRPFPYFCFDLDVCGPDLSHMWGIRALLCIDANDQIGVPPFAGTHIDKDAVYFRDYILCDNEEEDQVLRCYRQQQPRVAPLDIDRFAGLYAAPEEKREKPVFPFFFRVNHRIKNQHNTADEVVKFLKSRTASDGVVCGPDVFDLVEDVDVHLTDRFHFRMLLLSEN